jgi:tRNA modification GTPase
VEESDIRSLFENKEDGYSIPVLSFSAKQKTGFDELVGMLKDMFFRGKLSWNDEVVITNMRHCSLLQRSEESLKRVKESIDSRMSEDFFSIDLMDAYEALGGIIGEEIGDDLADEIFSRFCMGK